MDDLLENVEDLVEITEDVTNIVDDVPTWGAAGLIAVTTVGSLVAAGIVGAGKFAAGKIKDKIDRRRALRSLNEKVDNESEAEDVEIETAEE